MQVVVFYKHVLVLKKNDSIFLTLKVAQYLKAGLYDEFFFHRWLNFSFDSFLSTFNTCIRLRNVDEFFQSTIMKVFQKKKFLPDF